MSKKEEVLEFEYSDIDTEKGLMKHCELASTYNLKKGTHSKAKNYVINYLYASDIGVVERDIFMFLYDMKAQQKYLPEIQINNVELAKIFDKDKSSIGRSIDKLIKSSLLIKAKNIHGYDSYIINENINTWGLAIDTHRLSLLERMRKHLAGNNVYLKEQFDDYQKSNN